MNSRRIAVCLSVLVLGALSLVKAATDDLRLVEAVRDRNAVALKSLLPHVKAANVNEVDTQGMTALIWAAHWNDLDTVKTLIKAGANVKAANRFGSTALHEAATFGNAVMMEELLKAGADANAVRGEGDTPLMAAARAGVADAVALLVTHGANVNAHEGWYGETPLMLAANQNYTDVVKILLDHGADVNATSTAFNFPRRPAVDATTTVIPPEGGLTALIFAARQNSIESGKLLVEAGVNLDIADAGDKYTALLVAILNDNWKFATMLVEKGAKLDNALGMTEIMRNGPAVNDPGDAHAIAVRPAEALPFMELLIAHGANVDEQFARRPIYNRNGDAPTNLTAFAIAAGYVDVEGMRLLLKHGAHPVPQAGREARPGQPGGQGLPGGMSPLHLILAQLHPQWTIDDASYKQAVELCLSSGVNVNVTNSDGNTALHYAAGMGNDALVQFLVDHGANVRAKTKSGQTPLDWAEGKRPVRYGLDGTIEGAPPHETTVALLQKLMGTATSAQNTPAQ